MYIITQDKVINITDLNIWRSGQYMYKSGSDVICTQASLSLVVLLCFSRSVKQVAIHHKLSLHRTGTNGLQGGGRTLTIGFNEFMLLTRYKGR